MGFNFSYTLLASIYDAIGSCHSENIRGDRLRRPHNYHQQQSLIDGKGSGLYIPYLFSCPVYTSTELDKTGMH